MLYLHTELYDPVRVSMKNAVKFIINILSCIKSSKKVLKIGNGDWIKWNHIAQEVRI